MGITKVFFTNEQPIFELFGFLCKNMFANWRAMNATIKIMTNVCNFTINQMEKVLLINSVRKAQHFSVIQSCIPSYNVQRHSWLQLSVPIIIKERTRLPSSISDPLEKIHNAQIEKIIAASRIRYVKENPITVSKVYKGKEKRILLLSLTEDLGFQVIERKEGSSVIWISKYFPYKFGKKYIKFT